MIKKEIEMFKYNELPEDVRANVRDLYRDEAYEIQNSVYEDMFIGTLEAFCELFHVDMNHWEVCDFNYNMRFHVKPIAVSDYENPVTREYHCEYLPGLSDKLLYRYLCSNIMPSLIKMKRYCKWNGTECKLRESKVNYLPYDISMPLTGDFCDEDILKPLMNEFNSGCKSGKTYTDIIDDCLNSFFRCWRECKEEASSDQIVDEYINNNFSEMLFFSDGTEVPDCLYA